MAEAPDWQELQKIPLFSDLTEQEVYQINKLSFMKSYKKGQTLFVEGMPGEVLYVVVRGKVEIIKKTPKGEMVIASLGPGEFLGEMSLFDEEPRSATARIGDETELVVITKKCFNDMMHSDPHITSKLLLRFLKSVNERLRRTNKRFE